MLESVAMTPSIDTRKVMTPAAPQIVRSIGLNAV